MYSKYKDADPRDTINRIKKIFDQVGIALVCQTEKHIDGVYTSYLTDPVCRWRTEGKGTSVDFCEASAYGEAMEHICTHYAFDISTVSEHAKNYRGFFRYPDERQGLVDDIPNVAPIIMEEMKEPYIRLGHAIPQDSALIALWKQILKSDTTSFTPYYHINSQKTVFLPDAVLSRLCGTNGGGCGNTPEEAIGHALDEIIERWCKYTIFSQEMTPPEVPDSYLSQRCPELLTIKQGIEKQGQFRVLVLDASLGRQLPVVCIVIIDPQSKRYIVNFGCHPQFEIALERCFTEVFQDRRIVPELIERKDMAVWANFELQSVFSQRNWTKLLEDDLGLWPSAFFGTVPSWPFQEWPVFESYSNKEGMNSQLMRLLNLGADIYIRNVSFLGFPVYKIYIKGISVSHINYTDEILSDLSIVAKMKLFLSGDLSCSEMLNLSKTVFGKNSILGRMFFYRLTNEEFDILHAAFAMEYDTPQNAYNVLRFWTGDEATVIKRILETATSMSLESAIGAAKRFSAKELYPFIDMFFSDRPFHSLLTHYKFSVDSRKSMSGNTIQPDRDAFFTALKDFMAEHLVSQDEIKNIIQ